MCQRVEKCLGFAVCALASVSLLYSQTVECAENKLKLNITRKLTSNQPRLLPMHRLCLGEHESYCINGLCSFHENINTPSCTCHQGFVGERCEHMDLVLGVRSSYNLDEVIAISCGAILLLICLCVIGCICYRKRNSKPVNHYSSVLISTNTDRPFCQTITTPLVMCNV